MDEDDAEAAGHVHHGEPHHDVGAGAVAQSNHALNPGVRPTGFILRHLPRT